MKIRKGCNKGSSAAACLRARQNSDKVRREEKNTKQKQAKGPERESCTARSSCKGRHDLDEVNLRLAGGLSQVSLE